MPSFHYGGVDLPKLRLYNVLWSDRNLPNLWLLALIRVYV